MSDLPASLEVLQGALERVKSGLADSLNGYGDESGHENQAGLVLVGVADLRTLVSEVERLRDANDGLDKAMLGLVQDAMADDRQADLEITALKDRLARAEELLRPFADAAKSFVAHGRNTIILNTPSPELPNHYLLRKDFDEADAFLNAPPIKPEA